MIEKKELLRPLLLEVAALLTRGKEWSRAYRVEAAARDDQSVEAFLGSNDLWGGAGPIADEAIPSDMALRAELQSLLIQLGHLQLAVQIVNPRTEMWARAFENWQRLGLRTKQT
jgi:hypothetical protein